MRRLKSSRVLALGLLSLMITFLVLIPLEPLSIEASSIDNLSKEIDEFEEKQEVVESKKNKLKEEKEETEEKLNENKEEQSKTNDEIKKIDQQLSQTLSDIETKESEIDSAEKEIKAMEKEIDKLESEIADLIEEVEELEKRIKKREAILKERLRSLQQNGGSIKYIEVILGAKNFSDLISRSIAVTTIMNQDHEIMEEHESDQRSLSMKKNELVVHKEEVDDQKKSVENRKEELEDKKSQLVSLKDNLDNQKKEKDSLLQKLVEEQGDLELYTMDLDEQQETIKSQEKAIKMAKEMAKAEKAKLERQAKEQARLERLAQEKKKREEERKREKEREQNNNNGNNSGGNNSGGNTGTAPQPPTTGTGLFIWPTTGYVTDEFGERGGTHYGIDIGNHVAKNGGDVPIVAAASGVVSEAYYSPSYGYVVFISHNINGQDYQTVYAHLKYRPNVSQYQQVQKGQQIGIMGSTGFSTGPHLHFEVHKPKWNFQKSNAINPKSVINEPL